MNKIKPVELGSHLIPNNFKGHRKQCSHSLANSKGLGNYDQCIQEESKQLQDSPKGKVEKRSASIGMFETTKENLFYKKNQLSKQAKNQISVHEMNEQQILRKSQSGFVEKLKENLRKTVYKQTKMMIKEKRKKNKYRIESLDPPGTYRGGTSMQMFSFVRKANQTISNNHDFKRKESQKRDHISNTIIPTSNTQLMKQKKNQELQISKFPIIRRKRKVKGLDDLKKMFETIHTNHYKEIIPRRKQKQAQDTHSRSPSRQDIKPWETFIDHFD